MSELSIPKLPAGRKPSAWFRVEPILVTATGIAVGVCIDLAMLRNEGEPSVRSVGNAEIVWGVWIAAAFLNVVAHELGHLAAAIVLRMHPVEISVYGIRVARPRGRPRTTTRYRSYVRVDPGLSGPLLGPRFVGMNLAGPGVNLCLAGLCYAMAGRAGVTPMGRADWLMAADAGAVLGIRNLLPAGWWGSSRATDGSKAVRWLLWPARMRGLLAKGLLWERAARQHALVKRGGAPDRADLRQLTESGYPDVASVAVGILMKADAADKAMYAQDEALFLRLGESDRVTAKTAALLAATVALRRLMAFVGERRIAPRDVQLSDPAAVDEIARIAEAGYARDRDSVYGRCVLSLVRTIQHRPAEGRDLLVGISVERLARAQRATLLSVRALAEIDLGDIAQARRLAEAAWTEHPSSDLLGVVLWNIDLADKRAEG